MNLLYLIVILINYKNISSQIHNINNNHHHKNHQHHRSHNHTHNLLNNKRLCQNNNQLFQGIWEYGNDVYTNFNHCAKTKISIAESRLNYQIANYYCEKFRSAVYVLTNCHMFHLNDSINILLNYFIDYNNEDIIQSKKKINISYIGDSLGGQSFIAAKCDIENINEDNNINIEFLDDSSLRNDIPCNSQCIDYEYRLKWNS